MITKDIPLTLEVYSSLDELSGDDAVLLATAREATKKAYAPYSRFNVGVAARLTDGRVVTATNQENASSPVGICAERVLLSAVASQFDTTGITTMAISYNNLTGNSKHPISPCGICRQSLAEYEDRTRQRIRLILSGLEGEVYIVAAAHYLLPLSFSAGDLM